MSLTDDDNYCFICWNPLTKEHGRKEIIHKYDKENKSSEKWQHSCHEKCLNTWIKQCITVGDGIYPKCPICNDFKIPINKIPKPLRERATEILEQEEEEEEEEVSFDGANLLNELNTVVRNRFGDNAVEALIGVLSTLVDESQLKVLIKNLKS